MQVPPSPHHLVKLADLSSPAFLENPYPLYETLRRQGPFEHRTECIDDGTLQHR